MSAATPTKKISLKLKSKPAPPPEKTYYLAEGTLYSEFFTTYLEDKCSKGILGKIRKYWKDIDEEEGEGLAYKVFALENANDNVVEYTECWLLEYETGYIPIIVTGINTSSCYAGRRLYMDREIEECDNVKTQYTLDEISEILAPCFSKGGFCEIVEKLAN